MTFMKYILKLPSPFCKLVLPFLKQLNFMRGLEVRMLSKWLKDYRGLKILDAGCAEGIYSLEYARRGAFLIATDISKESVKIGNRFGKKLGLEKRALFFVSDITKIPTKNEFFDVVICNCVLEHVEDDLSALSEMGRVLREDGLLLLTVDSSERSFTLKFLNNIPARLQKLLLKEKIYDAESIEDGLRDYLNEKYCIKRRYSFQGLKTKLETANFKVIGHKYYLTLLGGVLFEIIHCFKYTTMGGAMKSRLPFMMLSFIFYPFLMLADLRPDKKGYGLGVIAIRKRKSGHPHENQTNQRNSAQISKM